MALRLTRDRRWDCFRPRTLILAASVLALAVRVDGVRLIDNATLGGEETLP